MACYCKLHRANWNERWCPGGHVCYGPLSFKRAATSLTFPHVWSLVVSAVNFWTHSAKHDIWTGWNGPKGNAISCPISPWGRKRAKGPEKQPLPSIPLLLLIFQSKSPIKVLLILKAGESWEDSPFTSEGGQRPSPYPAIHHPLLWWRIKVSIPWWQSRWPSLLFSLETGGRRHLNPLVRLFLKVFKKQNNL